MLIRKFFNICIIIFCFSIITCIFFPEELYAQSDLQNQYSDEMGDEEFERILRGLVRDTFFDIINDPIFGARLLKSPFYFYTKPIVRRQLLDNEFFQNSDFSIQQEENAFKITPFYVQTGKVFYTENKSGIKSYVDICQHGLIQTLDDLQFTNTVVPDFLALFCQLKTQERKLGFMIEYSGMINRSWFYQLQLPVVYQEYNYYLTSEERTDLINFFTTNEQIAIAAPATENSGSGGAAGIIKFIRRHLISDKCGCSDFKITFETIFNQTDLYSIAGGINLIVPVAFPLKQGIIGHNFNTSKKRPSFNLHTDLVDLFLDGKFQQLKINGLNLGIEIFDRVSTVLLEQQLGNRRHFGLGGFMRFKADLSERISFYTNVHTELLMPMIEKRFIKKQLDTPAFNAASQDNPVTQQQAKIDVDVLSVTFLDKMFPERYSVLVLPGLKLQATCMVAKEGNRWQGSLGSNIWFQASENLFTSSTFSDPLIFDLFAAQKGAAFQHKLFVKIKRNYPEHYLGWRFSMQLSGTTYSYGIGKEIAASVSLLKQF